MPAMAQRSAAQVRSILMDHGRVVETAFAECMTCGTRITSMLGDSTSVPDTTIIAEFEKAGWTVKPTRCPAHVEGAAS